MKPAAAAILLTIVPASALACGVCIEDKVAATYDHAVVTQAAARRHVVVFTALEGSAVGTALASDARQAALRIRGVDKASVRIAAEPAALSFALDPRAQSPQGAIDAIERNARSRALRVTLLRVVR